MCATMVETWTSVGQVAEAKELNQRISRLERGSLAVCSSFQTPRNVCSRLLALRA